MTMNRRSAAALLLALAAFHPSGAWAQGAGNSGNGNGGNGNGGGANAESNGGGNGNGNGSNGGGNGGGNGSGGVGAGQGNGSPGGQGQGNSSNGGARSPGSAELSQSEVLREVEAGRAVALETILPDVRSRTGGEVINASLQRVQGFLLYAVTVMDPAGKVSTEFYYAVSGQHVEK